jgi:hypothetical protein
MIDDGSLRRAIAAQRDDPSPANAVALRWCMLRSTTALCRREDSDEDPAHYFLSRIPTLANDALLDVAEQLAAALLRTPEPSSAPVRISPRARRPTTRR